MTLKILHFAEPSPVNNMQPIVNERIWVVLKYCVSQGFVYWE